MDTAPDELRQWFDREGLTRRLIEYSELEGITERVCDPLIALGPGDSGFRRRPTSSDVRLAWRSARRHVAR